ncbi:Uncharacterised protein [Bordetella pertussis]|nr:Uncharacterised protein [Bordetella pertussis]
MVTGSSVSWPRVIASAPLSSSARMRSMARVPQTSLPCTAPSTSNLGPGCIPRNWCARR